MVGDLGQCVETIFRRITVQPAWSRKISALRRIVFESSITSTLTPCKELRSDTSPPECPMTGPAIKRPYARP
jgi:hypothetical protein